MSLGWQGMVQGFNKPVPLLSLYIYTSLSFSFYFSLPPSSPSLSHFQSIYLLPTRYLSLTLSRHPCLSLSITLLSLLILISLPVSLCLSVSRSLSLQWYINTLIPLAHRWGWVESWWNGVTALQSDLTSPYLPVTLQCHVSQ